jgi:hypothetical protein
MKPKSLFTVFAGILLFVMIINFSSAAIDLTLVSKPTSVDNSAGSFNIVFSVNYTGSGDNTTVNFSGSGLTTGTGSITAIPDLNITLNETKQVTATVNFNSGQTGSIAGTIKANASGQTDELPFSVSLTQNFQDNFCRFDNGISSNIGDLDVTIDNVKVSGYGDDNEWFPFDEIEVEVVVDNRGGDDVDNIEVEWGLYDADIAEWVIDVDNENDFDLKNGKDDSVIFTFTIDDKMEIDLEDLDDGDRYIFFARATGEIAEGDDEGNDTCDWDSEDIELIVEDSFVISTDLAAPETISCGQDLQVSGTLWNIGSDDQDDVSLKIFAKDLDIEEFVTFDTLDSFDTEDFDISIPIPRNAAEKTYTLTFEVYDEDNDIFKNDFDDDESRVSMPLVVSGGCSTSGGTGGDGEPDAVIAAELESGGKAGEQLVVKALITNTGDEDAEYTINAAGYDEWADSLDITPETISVDSGDSREVLFTFDVKGDVSGDQLFTIELVSDGDFVAEQPVSVTIEEAGQGLDLGGIFGGNWYLWLIGLLNLILVIIIIVVAVRVARKK